MSVIGRQPTPAPLTAADVPQGVVTGSLGMTPILRNGGDFSTSTFSGGWDTLVPNSQYYKMGAFTSNPPGGAYNSMALYLSSKGMGGTGNTTEERAVQFQFADVPGNHYMRVRQGDAAAWHPWEKILTDKGFPRGLYTWTTTQVFTGTAGFFDCGVEFTITPRQVNSNFIMLWRVGGYWSPNGDAQARVLRNGTNIYENNRIAGNSTTQHETCPFWISDAPNTTSAVTYKLQVGPTGTGGSFDINHGGNKTQCFLMEFAS